VKVSASICVLAVVVGAPVKKAKISRVAMRLTRNETRRGLRAPFSLTVSDQDQGARKVDLLLFYASEPLPT
jgi:hypothetical protein